MSGPTGIEARQIRQLIARRLSGVANLRRAGRADLAAAMGISEARLARVLKGSSDLQAHELVLAARHLRAPLAVLCGELNPPPGGSDI